MSGIQYILQVAQLRLKLLLRQKFAMIGIGVGTILTIFCLFVANVSFVAPGKIFWDFSLGLSFVAQHLMAILLLGGLLSDEMQKRTLHLILVNGASRSQWLIGNLIGVWLALIAADLLWFGLSMVLSYLVFGAGGGMLLLQIKFLQWASVLIVLSFSQFFSVVLKPLLAIISAATLSIFLYSVTAVQRVFLDETAGHLIEASWSLKVFKLSKFLPPLEWYDWKIYFGYENQKSWAIVAGLLLFSFAWSALFLKFSQLAFDKKDL